MRCQFGERQYEYYLNKELESNDIFIPDQPFENHLGVDAATFSKNSRFWRLWSLWPFLNWRRGVYLEPELWDLTEQTLRDRALPKFKCNLFVQHKRPEYVSRARRGNAYTHWKQPYFKYDIDPHQQDILFKLERKVSSHALVVYACPAFWQMGDLCSFANGKMVENSNFAQPYKLKGHDKYTFTKRGKNGLACSKPEPIEGINLLQHIRKLREEKHLEFEDNIHFLHSLSSDIDLVVKDLKPTFQKAYFMIQENNPLPENKVGRSIVKILNFTLLAEVKWGIVYSG